MFRLVYFFATLTTRRRLAATIRSWMRRLAGKLALEQAAQARAWPWPGWGPGSGTHPQLNLQLLRVQIVEPWGRRMILPHG